MSEVSLDDDEPEARRLATKQIAFADGPEARDLLLRALGDVDWRVRKEATQIAAVLTPRDVIIRGLISGLRDRENIGLRNATVEALSGIGLDAVPVVIAALDTLDSDARKLAVEVLGAVADLRGAQALAVLLRGDDDANVRSAAAEALGRAALGGDSARTVAIAALTGALSSTELFLKLAALDSLTRLDAVLPWSVIRPLVHDPLLRRHAISAAACSRDPEAVVVLAEAASDVSQTVGREAIVALADCLQADPNDEAIIKVARRSLSSPKARARMRKMAQSNDPRARGAALITIGLARDPLDIPTLLDALTDDSVAEHAELGLMLYGGDAIGPLFDAGRKAPPAVRAASISIVPLLAPSFEHEVLLDLRDALVSPEPDVVLGALRALAIVGAVEDLVTVAKFVHHADVRIAASASGAAFAIATRNIDAARLMIDHLDAGGPDAVIGCVLLDAIARSTHPTRESDLAFLKSALSQASVAARCAALEALATFGGEASADAAAFALADEEREVVVAAVRALGRLGRTEPLEALVGATLDSALIATALRALADAAPQMCLRAALPLLRSAHPDVACAAVEVIGGLEGNGRQDALFVAVEHADGEVVKMALSELARAFNETVISRVAACLDHATREVRKHAAELLGHEGSAFAHELLRVRLERERDPAFRAALNAALASRPTSIDA